MKNPVSQHGVMLYYPYLGIKDLNWLKAALLYWDGIRRIAPENEIYDDEPDEVRTVVNESLLLATDPQPYLDAAANRFRQYAFPLYENPYRELRRVREIMKVDFLEPFNISAAKMPPALQAELREKGLLQRRRTWLGTDGAVNHIYI